MVHRRCAERRSEINTQGLFKRGFQLCKKNQTKEILKLKCSNFQFFTLVIVGNEGNKKELNVKFKSLVGMNDAACMFYSSWGAQ